MTSLENTPSGLNESHEFTDPAPVEAVEATEQDADVAPAPAPAQPAISLASLPKLGNRAVPRKWGADMPAPVYATATESATGSADEASESGDAADVAAAAAAAGEGEAVGASAPRGLPKNLPTLSSRSGAVPSLAPRPYLASLPQSQQPRTQSGQAVITFTLNIPSDASLVSAAVAAAMRAKKVVIEASKSPVPNKATFMVKGKSAADVEAARQLLEENLAPKIASEVSIPSSARSALIGPRGANLRAIEKKHGVKIDLRNEAQTPWTLDRTSVAIEGSKHGVRDASAAVLAVVDESRQVSSSRHFDAALQPFVAADAAWAEFVSRVAPRVTLHGNLAEVTQAMQNFDAFLATLQSSFESLDLPKSDASAGIPFDLVFAEYGVIVRDDGQLYGPRDQLKRAAAKVQKYLDSQTVSVLDIAQAYDRNLPHARLLTRYFAAAGILENIANEHNVSITGPVVEGDGVVYTFSGEDTRAAKARKALVQQVNAHSPSSIAVVRGMRYQLVRRQAKQALAQLKGPVKGLIGPSDELFLEFVEPEDDFSPQDADIKRYMDEAVAQLEPLAQLAKSVVRKSVKVGEGNATFVVHPLGPEAQSLWDEHIGQRGDVGVELEDAQTVVVTGLKPAVEEAQAVFPRLTQLSRTYSLRSSHVEEFKVDPSIVGNLIGRQGAQIQSMREKYDVKMEVDESGVVHLQGVEEQTRACAKEVLDMQRRLRDEATENLVVPSEFHAKLIGPRGKHVKRLREQHACVIRFPRSRQGSAEPEDDTASVAGGGGANSSSSGGAGSTANAAADDIIIIKGPSRGVAAIKKEFLDLVAYERAQSFTRSVKVPASVVPRLVGRGGLAINAIRNNTGTQINVGTPVNDEDVEIVVIGDQKSVNAAVDQITEAAGIAMDATEVVLEVAPEFHRLLIGNGNATRRELVAAAGGDPEEAGRILVVGVNGHDSPLVRISGPSAVVAKLQAQVVAIVDDAKRKSQASETLVIPRNRLKFVLGAGGNRRRDLEEKHDVFIQIPKDPKHVSPDSTVALTVQGVDDATVAQVITSLRRLALPAELRLEIPAPLWSPRLASQLLNQYKVRADLVSTSTQSSHTTVATVAEPAEPADGSNWAIKTVEAVVQVLMQGETDASCEKAAAYLRTLSAVNTYGYLWTPRQKHRAIVGTGGKTINKLRQQSQAQIEVPQASKAEGKPIVIVGSKEQVEAAKALILEAIA